MLSEIKEIGKVLQEAGKIELYSKVLDMQEKLLEKQNQIQTLTEENRSLRAKIMDRQNFKFERGAYWAKNDETPFCSVCFDTKDQLVRMRSIDWNDGSRHWHCHSCKNGA